MMMVAMAPVRYSERQSQAVAVHLSLPPAGLKQKMTTCFITNSIGYRNIKEPSYTNIFEPTTYVVRSQFKHGFVLFSQFSSPFS